ncbi:MAG: D-amino acid aminotransferase [bacterium]|nr:D-amino acid aminotransferase [Gammaproteobacteria bacterium]HIL97856.1 D-amino acid aminotransferase [Pseudomonadales bacterium]
MSISYLNGQWQPIEEAKVSVLDRGFLFGDGVYEVIPVYKGRPFTLPRHLTRLNNSLAEIKLSNPLSDDDWSNLIEEAIRRSGETTAALYLQITRGADKTRVHVYPDALTPTIFLMVSPAPVLERKAVPPYKVITLDDYRWSRGHIKTVSLIAACMLKNEAVAQGVDDAILIRDGVVTESTSSNVFVVLDGVIVTAPKSLHLLHGITRDLVVELAAEKGLPIEERTFTADELASASEVFITSSTHETWPVGVLNGKAIGNGEAGVVWQEVDKLFQAYKSSL